MADNDKTSAVAKADHSHSAAGDSIEARLSAVEGLATQVEGLTKAVKTLSEVDPDARKGGFEAKSTETDAEKAARLKTVNFNKNWPRGDETKFSIAKSISAMLGVKDMGYERSWGRFPYEKAVVEAAYKAGSEDTGAGLAGTPSSTYGFLVPPQFITDMIEVVRAKTVVRALGARTLTAASNVGFVPRQSAAAAANWIAETSSITASDLTFQQIQYTLRKMAAYVVLSNELIMDADPAVEAIIRDDISSAIALQEDITALQGSGTAPTPRGIKNVSGIGTAPSLGTNGSTPTFDNLIDAEAAIRVANRQMTGWAVNPRTVTTLRKIKDTSGRYIWEPAPYNVGVVPSLHGGGDMGNYDFLRTAGAVAARPTGYVLGVPVYETSQIPVNLTVGSNTDCSDIYAAQWDELLIVERGGMEFAASDQILFQNYQTAIRAIVRRDFLVRHAAAFNVTSGVRP